ncbi:MULTISPECIES: NAD(P)/FAD-dependent oxidoreductase [unclassified Kitasatospora]|uniref:flavin-containing monooxygenase n=1 Tax=unclassified Kitasatospora TaxID=2633591 RepID=UPI00070FC8F2|nr:MULTISPECIES: NAD(P)/FAD-dependent oxidoreductase [unclassified Kitasatospora]KQV04583.1 cyclohexanone monooxygenase [Kitasatospora sp. Root107]KRB60890.1 cyclohexanone monooxygenase [Kitasatospora sp. Root187]
MAASPKRTKQRPTEGTPHVRVAVVGSGFGGLGAGVRLRRAGITDFVILERADSVGGTWRDNSYPGCACDVPSHLYSFSFAPNPDWPRSFSGQPDIRAYLERVTDTFGLRPHLRFNAEVTELRWEQEHTRWRISTAAGDWTADAVVSASGPLADPQIPELPGLAEFPGKVFHSSRWDHDYDLTGKRVAMVGTGASAAQIIPQIQPKVGKLTVFQRTPAWVLPRRDREISGAEKWLHAKLPPTGTLRRAALFALREMQVDAFVRRPGALKLIEQLAVHNIHKGVADPELRARLTPDYRIGCKRILLSNTYYPALAAANAEVVSAGLTELRGSTLVAADGSEHEVDAIVFGTGFHVTDMPIAHRVFGIDGVSLAEEWKGGMEALRGSTVRGFPNLFFVIGPNTGLGNSSMILMIESQLNYLIDALTTLAALGGGALQPTARAQRQWNLELQHRMSRTVWSTGGCRSWYQDEGGKNTVLWPASTSSFRRATRRLDLAEYEVIRQTAPVAEEALA